jgi:hypothetical protein
MTALVGAVFLGFVGMFLDARERGTEETPRAGRPSHVLLLLPFSGLGCLISIEAMPIINGGMSCLCCNWWFGKEAGSLFYFVCAHAVS